VDSGSADYSTESGRHSGTTLTDAVRKWPTPCAQEDNKSPEAHLAMKANMPGGPRNTVTSLQVMAKMWPTPNTPNGGRTMKEEDILAKGATDKGKRQVGLENLAKMWTTPKTTDFRNDSQAEEFRTTPNLAKQSQMWATPKALTGGANSNRENREETGGWDLQEQVAKWPSPAARDWKADESAPAAAARHSPCLPSASYQFLRRDQAAENGSTSCATTRTSRQRLSPMFDAWLMGMPFWWTNPGTINCAALETRLWRSKLRLRLRYFLKAFERTI
jgi:hypothetical protein